MKKRLSKVLAQAGIASRRSCERLIIEGAVSVNGSVVLLPGTLVNPDRDRIEVSGKPVKDEEEKVYYLLNKPKGYLCTHKRPHPQAKIVFDLFPECQERLFTAGRLDKMTEGLIVVTNDGALAHKMIHPSSGVQKEYLAKVREFISHSHLETLSRGIEIGGERILPSKVSKVRKNTLKIVVMEGKKHEVRLMLQQAELELIELKRIRIGNLHLGKLGTGDFKRMSKRELEGVF